MRAAAPSFERNRETYCSIAFGVSSSSQLAIVLMSRSFDTRRPALSAKHSRIAHSRCVSSSGWPSALASLCAMSSVSLPSVTVELATAFARRINARQRAISSGTSNGLVM